METRWQGWLVVTVLSVTAVYALSETFTLETYYPSPRGVYAELRVGGGGPWPTGSGRDAPGYLEVIHYDQSKQNPAFRVDTDNPATRPVVVDYLGNVGIGTTDPGAKLQVRDSTSGSITPLIIDHSANWNVGDENRIDFTQATTAISRIANFYEGGSGSWGMKFYNSYAGSGMNSTPSLTLLGNGKVGIGTTNPGAKLAIALAATTANNSFSEALHISNYFGALGDGSSIGFWAGTATADSWEAARIAQIHDRTEGTYGALAFSTSNAGGLAERMRISSAGTVGIGVTPLNNNTLTMAGNLVIRPYAGRPGIKMFTLEVNSPVSGTAACQSVRANAVCLAAFYYSADPAQPAIGCGAAPATIEVLCAVYDIDNN